jgi:hypothetical protein
VGPEVAATVNTLEKFDQVPELPLRTFVTQLPADRFIPVTAAWLLAEFAVTLIPDGC